MELRLEARRFYEAVPRVKFRRELKSLEAKMERRGQLRLKVRREYEAGTRLKRRRETQRPEGKLQR